ncbi:MAG: sulfatase-like hydrolase/transferase [Planctomycetota bacterium]|nr:MAG: sulfatase-like hydrolase/transferase [Planctomycetota bacterium]
MFRIIIFIGIIFLVQFCIDSARGQGSNRPNVLVIYADQHRFDCLGAMGNPDVKTPNLDRLARDGVLFNNSFCVWPVCTPSRYSLLTGQYVRQHGGRSNRCTLQPGTPTFANILREAGYKTKAVGKMHFMPAYLDVGFDELELAEQHGDGRLVDDYHRYLRERGLIDSLDLIDQVGHFRKRAPDQYWQTFGAMVSNLSEEHHSTTWIGNRAVHELGQWESSRLGLLMVGFIKPHHPFDPPAPWNTMYDPAKLTILPGWTDRQLACDRALGRGYFDNSKLTLPALRRVMAYYYATISQIDDQVGRMIETLKGKGLYDNTLVIYTADHGEFMGFHHMLLKGNHMYDPLIKVPLIVKFPDGRHAGKVSDSLVNSLDVTGTIIREAGCELGPDMRGRPLGPILAGEQLTRKLVFAECGPYTMVRSKSHKLLHHSGPGKSLFFDLKKDPQELDNLYEDPKYQSQIDLFQEALMVLFVFRAEASVYLDLEAQQIARPNVPPDREAAEMQMREYIDQQMAKELSK